MCIKQLALNWLEYSTTDVTRTSVNKRIDTFAKEAPEYTAEIVLALLEIADENYPGRSRAVPEPSVVSSAGFRLLLGWTLSACFTPSGNNDASYEAYSLGVFGSSAD